MLCPRCGEPMTNGICDNCGFPTNQYQKCIRITNYFHRKTTVVRQDTKQVDLSSFELKHI